MDLEINKRITECRKKAGIKKTEMARLLNIKYTTYCNMENTGKRIKFEIIEHMAEIFGVDKNYLIYGEKQQYDFTPLEPKGVVVESPNRGTSPFETQELPVIKYSHGEFDCSSEEKALVLVYRSLPPQKKQMVRDLIDNINK